MGRRKSWTLKLSVFYEYSSRSTVVFVFLSTLRVQLYKASLCLKKEEKQKRQCLYKLKSSNVRGVGIFLIPVQI